MSAPDQPIREAVVRARKTCQIVEAAAGTGKTTLLVTRVLSLLETGTRVSRLAVITFTRKAAAELVARLRRQLTEERHAGHAWAAGALDDLDLSFVGTVDAFCRSLLSDFPIEAGVPPGFGVADEIAQAALLESAWQRFLERSPDAVRMLSRLREVGVRTESIRDVADELLSNRDLELARPRAGATPDLTESFAAELEPALALRDLCKQGSDRLALHLGELERELTVARSLDPPAAERLLLQRRRAGRRYGSRQGRAAHWGGPDNKMRVVQRLERLEEAVDEFLQARGSRLAAETVRWLHGYFDEYAHAKRERALLDFRDLALHTRELLHRNPAARRRVSARFDEILMDEAQDTDPLQMEIAFLLAADDPIPDDPLEAKLIPGKLFLVGDPKQSIYRFRRADLELYGRAREKISEAGEASVIQANFRSHPSVLEFVNRVFAGWMDEEDRVRYVPLMSGREPEVSGGVSLLLPDDELEKRLRERSGREKLRHRERSELEVDAVARLVRSALGAGGEPWTVRDPESGAARDLRPGDVAVLVRKIDWGDRLLEVLRGAGIPAAVAGGKRFYAREEIQTLLCLLEAMIHPEDPFARFAALRSPALGFSDDELVRRFLDEDAARTEDALGRTEELLERLGKAARTLAVPEFLDLLSEELSLLPVFGFRPDGRGRVEGLRTLLEAADSLAAAGFDSLPGLHRWLRDQAVSSRGSGLEEIDPGADGVQILTMHKSKGLEFPVVILADLTGEPRRGQPVVSDRRSGRVEFRLSEAERIATPGFHELAETERARQLSEDVRLLYVAMTRARDRLVLSWPPGARGFLAGDDLSERIGCPPGKPAPEGSDLVTIRARELPPLEPKENLFALDLEGIAPLAAPAEKWREARRHALRGVRVLPASSLGPPTPRAHAGGERMLPAREFGQLVHKALELHDPSSPDGVARTLSAAIAALGAEPAPESPLPVAAGSAAYQEALEFLERVLRDPSLTEAWGAPRILREVPFLLPAGEDFVSGTIDLLVEAPDGTLSIVDYKTEPLGEEAAEAAKERYRAQALAYAEAVSRITQRPVREVRFLFLSSDPVEVGSFFVDSEFLLEARALISAGRTR